MSLPSRKSPCFFLGRIPSKFGGFSSLPSDTLPATNIAPENWWLEDEISFWEGPFRGELLVFGRVVYRSVTINSRISILEIVFSQIFQLFLFKTFENVYFKIYAILFPTQRALKVYTPPSPLCLILNISRTARCTPPKIDE